MGRGSDEERSVNDSADQEPADRGSGDPPADREHEEEPPGDELPGRPATRRNRAKSAALWGAIGFFAFLVVAQGYLLLGGDLPVRYAALFGIAFSVGLASGVLAYLMEYRLTAKGRV